MSKLNYSRTNIRQTLANNVYATHHNIYKAVHNKDMSSLKNYCKILKQNEALEVYSVIGKAAILAAKLGNTDAIAYFHTYWPSIVDYADKNGNNMVHTAVIYNQYPTIYLLKHLGFPLNTLNELIGASASHYSIKYSENTNIINFLMKQKAVTSVHNVEFYNLAKYAAYMGKDIALEYFLKIGVRPDYNDPSIKPLMFYAIAGGQVKSVQMLMSFGASISLGPDGMDSIYLAASSGNVQLLHLIEKIGFDLKICDPQGNNALHYASGHEVAEYLIIRGVDLNVANYQGMTPLHMALRRGEVKVADSLLAHGADITIEDQHYMTPEHLFNELNIYVQSIGGNDYMNTSENM